MRSNCLFRQRGEKRKKQIKSQRTKEINWEIYIKKDGQACEFPGCQAREHPLRYSAMFISESGSKQQHEPFLSCLYPILGETKPQGNP